MQQADKKGITYESSAPAFSVFISPIIR